MAIVVACDVGGTFSDAVAVETSTGRLASHKHATTPGDHGIGAAAACAGAVRALGAGPGDARLVLYGTTTATNALLSRRGPAVALVTNAGFEDLVEIGRQDRPSLYDLDAARPEPLARREHRFGLGCRRGHDGRVIEPLDPSDVEAVAARIGASGAGAVAVCLLHAWADGSDERAVAAHLRKALGVPVTASADVAAEFREVERANTALANAFLGPVVERALQALDGHLRAAGFRAPVQLLDSAGGLVTAAEAARVPVRVALSGPAGGAALLRLIAADTGLPHLVGVDVGGTSTDVALLLEGVPPRTTRARIAGLDLLVPGADVHAVGAGGGSIAWIDDGGGLRVGPQSAEAVPGPACWGLGGTQPTLTDANVVLGRIPADAPLGGSRRLDAKAATAAVAALGARLGLSAEAAAWAVLEVAAAVATRAVRVMLARHGADPADLSLVAFGGAGPLHAVEWARELGIGRVVVPAAAGTGSALGLLAAPPTVHASRTAPARLADAGSAWLRDLHDGLAADAAGRLGADARVLHAIDARYAGQSHEIGVPFDPAAADALGALEASFHAAHAARWGYARRGAPIELVTHRAAAVVPAVLARSPPAPPPAAASAMDTTLWSPSGPVTTRRTATLAPGSGFEGPLLVTRQDCTVLVPAGCRGRVTGHGHLVIEVGGPA